MFIHLRKKTKNTPKKVVRDPKILHNENPHIKTTPKKKFIEMPTEKRYSK